MVSIDLTGTTTLITGGTQGIGRAAAFDMAKAGSRVFVTCKWDSVDADALREECLDATGATLEIINADVSIDDDTENLLSTIAKSAESVDFFVSNVGFAPSVQTLDDYSKRSLFKTFEYSSWPLIEYTKRIHTVFKRYPSRIVAISSDGPDHYYRGYDYVSAAKALLEHFAKYLSVHLLPMDSRVNVLRFGTVKTPSFDAIFGNDFFEFAKGEGLSGRLVLTPEECGKAILALMSGLLDALNGQVVTVDYGLPFQDNLMMRFLDWREKKK